MSVKDALDRYYRKQMKADRKQTRGVKKNQKPEKVLEAQVLLWAQANGFFLHVVESKAVYSAAAGRYLRGQAEAGLPDLIGNFEGRSVWIELKASGRRSTLKEHQREFLFRKVKQGCFACCVDSVKMLEDLVSSFLSTPSSGRCQLLLADLPRKKDRYEAEGDVF